MRMMLLGTGGALPPKGRAQTGIFLQKGSHSLLLDCGSGVLFRMDQAGIDWKSAHTVLLSHHHLDHMSDLLPLVTARWLAGHPETRLYGPEGTAALIEDLLGHYEYVRKHVNVQVTEVEGGSRFEANGFRTECLRTEHGEVPACAYKFDDLVAVSGDTRPFPKMAEFADGCRILVHECSFPDGRDEAKHTTPQKLGSLLAGRRIDRLVLTHLYPEVIGREDEVVRSVKDHFGGEVLMGEDLLQFEV